MQFKNVCPALRRSEWTSIASGRFSASGRGDYSIDLSGDWPRDLDVAIDAGATDIRLLLPREVGARVWFEDGPHIIEAAGMLKDGPVYTNDAFGVSPVTLHINIESGIGFINLEVAEAAAAPLSLQ